MLDNSIVIGYGVIGKATAYALDIKYHFDADISKSNIKSLKDFISLQTTSTSGELKRNQLLINEISH